MDLKPASEKPLAKRKERKETGETSTLCHFSVLQNKKRPFVRFATGNTNLRPFEKDKKSPNSDREDEGFRSEKRKEAEDVFDAS